MAPATDPPSRWRAWLPWIAGGAAWLAVVRTLAVEWSVLPQYHYGWAVPVLCLWLFARRWNDRPVPSAPRSAGWFWLALAASYLPLRFVLEAFPDWRPALWLLALQLVALSLALLREAGGSAWARHFAFPVGFVLTAVPWPTPLEAPAIHGLTNLNASLASGLLTLFGHPAVQRGSIIETARGLVGVDEACSGIRSLQAALMLALLGGEFFRLSARRRSALFAGGIALALLTNLGRTLWLIGVVSRGGPDALAGAHDEAGVMTMLVCVAGLGLLGWRWRANTAAPAPTSRARPVSPPSGTVAAMLGIVLLGEAGTELWFRLRSPDAPAAAWRIEWPRAADRFREIAIRPAVREVLRLDTGEAAAWRDRAGRDWTVHRLRWEPRPAQEAILAKYHTPDVCLPAAGCLLREDLGVVSADAGALHLEFRGYAFEEAGATLFVFFLLSEDRGETRAIGSVAGERLRLVWEGKRYTGQTVLHLALRGCTDRVAAETALRDALPSLVKSAP